MWTIQDPPMETAPVITRVIKRMPMGNCDVCYAAGKVDEGCKHCKDGDYETMRFHDKKRWHRIQNPDFIVDPRELANAVDKPVMIPLLKQREFKEPIEWTPVNNYYLGEFIEEQLTGEYGSFGTDDLHEELNRYADALKFDRESFSRKYYRRENAYAFDADSDYTTEDENDNQDRRKIG